MKIRIKRSYGIIAALLMIVLSLVVIILLSSCENRGPQPEVVTVVQMEDQEAVIIERFITVDKNEDEIEDNRPVTVTRRMEELHQLAEDARELGFADDSALIKSIQEEWAKEQKELKILGRTIYSESQGCPEEHQIAVGCVVKNRVDDPEYPNTIEAVVRQKHQYNPDYADNYEGLDNHYYRLARDILDGVYSIPSNVVYQNTKPQGSGIWWTSHVKTPYWESTTYFCYK